MATTSNIPTTLAPATVLPIHEFYQDNQLIIGHSDYPSTQGHTLATLKTDTKNLFALSLNDFKQVMITLRTIAQTIRSYYQVERCALITEGGNTLSILPLHGLTHDWKPIMAAGDVKEFHITFPGYISSRNGPTMGSAQLDEICSKIRSVSLSGLSSPPPPTNYHFDGPDDDENLFVKIIRGQIQQWRVWEDDEHVAFLTPFANTEGFTVLVPRAHLSSDIFSIKASSYTKLMAAAHNVAGILIEAFHIQQCGMIFEGFEIDYAHVKLIPIHAPPAGTNDPPLKAVAPFYETYQGYVSSLDGPICSDFPGLVRTTQALQRMMPATDYSLAE